MVRGRPLLPPADIHISLSSAPLPPFRGCFSSLQVRGVLLLMWRQSFRLMDDDHESIQVAAGKLGRALLNLTGRVVNSSESSANDVTEAIETLLPLLLEASTSQVSTSAGQGRAIAMGALLRCIKGAGSEYLTPFIPRLVVAITESLSMLEPSMLPYLQFHTATLDVRPTSLPPRTVLLCPSPYHARLHSRQDR